MSNTVKGYVPHPPPRPQPPDKGWAHQLAILAEELVKVSLERLLRELKVPGEAHFVGADLRESGGR